MNTDKWFDFDKVDCIQRISNANESLLESMTYCSSDRICDKIKKQIYSNNIIIKEIINTGVFENEE